MVTMNPAPEPSSGAATQSAASTTSPEPSGAAPYGSHTATAKTSASRMTAPAFSAAKASGRKLAMITAYDFPTARLVDDAGIDAILVGDSLAMTVQGHDSTLPATLEHLIYHAEIVGRAATRALAIVDLPFPIGHFGPDRTLEAAARIVQQTRCQAVKIEGGVELASVIRRLATAGIPVMGHVGLLPQSVHATGGYRVQRDRERILADAKAVQDAGAFAIVLECVPTPIAAEVTAALAIPTIGIGAGPECDGQVLVLHDLLGLTSGHVPRFVKQYLDLRSLIGDAVRRYVADVRDGHFPDASQSFAK
ncbi:MAG: hypothetical protein RLY70_2642 [Planctomycetota bacterium]|jgi:3-methyl-2-oxobutanoate hydroxymethyltransferase